MLLSVWVEKHQVMRPIKLSSVEVAEADIKTMDSMRLLDQMVVGWFF